MNAQQTLKVLELDLTGSNLTVIIDESYIEESYFKHLFTDVGAFSLDKLKPTVRKFLEYGRNFILFNNPLLLDSQLKNFSDSIKFCYIPSNIDPDDIVLSVYGTDKASVYEKPGRIGFRSVPQLVNTRGLKYASLPDKVYTICEIEGFKSEIIIPQPVKPFEKPLKITSEPVPTESRVTKAEKYEPKITTPQPLKPLEIKTETSKIQTRLTKPEKSKQEEQWTDLVGIEMKQPSVDHDETLGELLFLSRYISNYKGNYFRPRDLPSRKRVGHLLSFLEQKSYLELWGRSRKGPQYFIKNREGLKELVIELSH